MRNFSDRLKRLETASGFGEVVFRLGNGSRAAIRCKEILFAVSEAIDGRRSRRAQIMLNATRASDGSHLHEMAQAIATGPVPHGEVNDEE